MVCCMRVGREDVIAMPLLLLYDLQPKLPAAHHQITVYSELLHQNTADPTNTVLKPEKAWNIDTKIDDGKPGTGHLIGLGRTWGANACTTAASATDTNAAAPEQADWLDRVARYADNIDPTVDYKMDTPLKSNAKVLYKFTAQGFVDD